MLYDDAEHSTKLLEDAFPENTVTLVSYPGKAPDGTIDPDYKRSYGVEMVAPEGIPFSEFDKVAKAAEVAENAHLLPSPSGGIAVHIS